MKIGIEVEGRLRGIRTMFVDSEALMLSPHKVRETMTSYAVSHLYISDHNGLYYYSYELLAKEYEGCLITLEVTSVNNEQPLPDNITIMLSLPMGAHPESFLGEMVKLRPSDQVKVSIDPHYESNPDSLVVMCAPVSAFVRTFAHEFKNDQVLS